MPFDCVNLLTYNEDFVFKMEVLFNTFHFVVLAELKEIVRLSEDFHFIWVSPSKAGGGGVVVYNFITFVFFTSTFFVFEDDYVLIAF